MSQVVKGLKVKLDETLEEKLKLIDPHFSDYRLLKKSLDSRGRHAPHYVYSLELYGQNENMPERRFTLPQTSLPAGVHKPIIVGAGPAGLFAALRLVEQGIPCTLLEQGSPTLKRLKSIARYWKYGELDPDDNVCHGEGGAGLFSDGKLITRIKSPHIQYVMNKLVQFGAPKEIEYLSNPHVGSDKIRRVIPVLRDYLKENGCDIQFSKKVTEFIIEDKTVKGVHLSSGQSIISDHVVLACGHSASDMFYTLQEQGVYLEAKPFAMGLRVEHPQSAINKIQYKDYHDHPSLSSANYKLTYNNKEKDIGVYSFCMCPGGYVLSSSTDQGTMVCNGMSNYRRNSPHANSAIVVSVDVDKSADLFSGLKKRTQVETQAFDMVKATGGNKELPAQSLTQFLNRSTGTLPGKTSSLSGAVAAPIWQLFSEDIYQELAQAFSNFDQKMKGFISNEAIVFGVESRTSCPLRITRNAETLQSISHQGLYPCGEGAGYAGGITSAACDGIRIADSIVQTFQSISTSANI